MPCVEFDALVLIRLDILNSTVDKFTGLKRFQVFRQGRRSAMKIQMVF